MRSMDAFFTSPRGLFSLTSRVWVPPTDIFETHDKIVIRIEVPGVAQDSLSVTAHGPKLIVRGRREEPKHSDIHCYHQREVQYGEFERVFRFPFPLSNEEIRASFDAGFLSIEAPKKASAPAGLTVEVLIEGAR